MNKISKKKTATRPQKWLEWISLVADNAVEISFPVGFIILILAGKENTPTLKKKKIEHASPV